MRRNGDLKRCSRCRHEKHISEFSVDRRQPDGHTARCKGCNAKQSRAYRLRKLARYDWPAEVNQLMRYWSR